MKSKKQKEAEEKEKKIKDYQRTDDESEFNAFDPNEDFDYDIKDFDEDRRAFDFRWTTIFIWEFH